MKKAVLGRIYVWEIPVRFYHWLNFVDYVEGRGALSSMGGGWKFIEKECKPDA